MALSVSFIRWWVLGSTRKCSNVACATAYCLTRACVSAGMTAVIASSAGAMSLMLALARFRLFYSLALHRGLIRTIPGSGQRPGVLNEETDVLLVRNLLQVVHVMAALRVADHLASGAKTADELTELTGGRDKLR